MKRVLGFTLGLLVLLAPLVSAQGELPSPGSKKGDLLYGLDRALEGVQLALTFDKVSKARLHYKFAEERLAEAQALSEEGKTELTEATLEDYEGSLAETNTQLEDAIATGEDPTEVTNQISERNFLHIEILTKIRGKVPAAARERIENVIERAVETQASAIEKLEVMTEKIENISEDCKQLIEDLEGKELDNAGQVLLGNAKKHLERSEAASAQNKSGRAFGQLTAACANARNAAKHVGEEMEEEQADLMPADLVFSPSTILEGENLTITVDIQNTGTVNAENYTVGFFDMTNNLTIGEQMVTLTEAGNSTIVSIEYATVVGMGNHTVVMTADSTNAIAEANETNNILEGTFVVG